MVSHRHASKPWVDDHRYHQPTTTLDRWKDSVSEHAVLVFGDGSTRSWWRTRELGQVTSNWEELDT